MDNLTAREGFEAMRCFLEQFNKREPPDRRETINQILRWTEMESDGLTYDPAQWEDWLESIETARQRLR